MRVTTFCNYVVYFPLSTLPCMWPCGMCAMCQEVRAVSTRWEHNNREPLSIMPMRPISPEDDELSPEDDELSPEGTPPPSERSVSDQQLQAEEFMGCLNDPVLCFMTVFCCPCTYALTRERAGLQAREPAALSIVAAVMAQPILFAFVSRYTAGETLAVLCGGFMGIGLPIWGYLMYSFFVRKNRQQLQTKLGGLVEDPRCCGIFTPLGHLIGFCASMSTCAVVWYLSSIDPGEYMYLSILAIWPLFLGPYFLGVTLLYCLCATNQEARVVKHVWLAAGKQPLVSIQPGDPTAIRLKGPCYTNKRLHGCCTQPSSHPGKPSLSEEGDQSLLPAIDPERDSKPTRVLCVLLLLATVLSCYNTLGCGAIGGMLSEYGHEMEMVYQSGISGDCNAEQCGGIFSRTCYCKDDFVGDLCDESCGPHGSSSDGTACTCKDGFIGRLCNETCGPHGSPNDGSTCTCKDDFIGRLCDIPCDCHNRPAGSDHAAAPANSCRALNCICGGNMVGETCSETCGDHGQGDGLDTCTCDSNHVGRRCEKSCGTHGTAESGRCVCEDTGEQSDNYVGTFCELAPAFKVDGTDQDTGDDDLDGEYDGVYDRHDHTKCNDKLVYEYSGWMGTSGRGYVLFQPVGKDYW
eukprot:SAG25_NODE_1723_length_2444_cov_1.411940_1_plen_631_part_10